jgi:hypothetical protein
MIKPVNKDTTTPAVSFLNPLLIISPFVMATPKVIERIGPIRGDTGGGGHQIRKHIAQDLPSIEAITEVGLSESRPAPAIMEAMAMRAKKSKVRWFPSSMTSYKT